MFELMNKEEEEELKTRALLIIDGQGDFMNSPKLKGALAVEGAYEDMLRLAEYINNEDFDSIVLTLDTHSKMHIAHSMWWVNEKGENPSPFTQITVEDVLSGKWKASQKNKIKSSIEYVKKLEAAGKYKLLIWPYHCIEGSEGHKIVEVLKEAVDNWEKRTGKKAIYVLKGQNPNTEMYSGLKAEVIMPKDPRTKLNKNLVVHLNGFSSVEVAGEAKSHCAASTTYDLIDEFEKIAKGNAKKITILENCMSNVSGFEENGNKFIEDAKLVGCKIKNVPDIVVKKPKNKF